MKRVLRDVVLGAMSVATVGAGTVLAASGDAYAQEGTQGAAPAAQQSGVAIRRVLVEGNQRIEPATITSYLLVRPGDTFDAERIDLSLKTLFATGLFADVQIEQRGGDLVVSVIENPVINRVIFEGMRTLDEEDLEDEVQARPRSVFTPARAQGDVQRIIEVYRRAGRFAAQVTPQVRELDQNRVDLIFEVDEGPVTGIRSVNFIGNEAFSDRRLRDAIVTAESSWWNFFSNNDNYDPDRLEYDREQLRQYYNNRGYADFRVVSAVAELTPDQKDFFVTFTVEEGPRYEFGEVRVQTELNRLSEGLLRAAIPIRTGTEFRGDMIEDSIDAMTYVAGTVGYANVDIVPMVERDPVTRRVNITFEVDEGPRVFIERIDIVGNTRTIDPVIRRELMVSEGDAFNRVLLDRSRQRIRALGFFGDVTIEDTDGSQPDRSVVTVTVEEQSTGELAFAAGYSSTESLLFDVSVTERNLRGRGQFLRLRASSSSQRQQVDIRFTEPRFLGREIAAGIDIYSLRTDFRSQSSFENQSTGVGLRTSFPVSDRTSLGLTYSLIQDETEIANIFVDHDDDDLTPVINQCDTANPARPYLCDQEGTFITSVLGATINMDRRNDPVRATRGYDLQLSQDIAGLGGEVNYLRTELEGGLYYGLWGGFRATFRGSAGFIDGWGGDDIRINDRFFKGGSSFRGFDVAGIGPRQLIVDDTTGEIVQEGDALGGNVYAIGTFQLDVPLPLPESFSLGSALFVDFGTLGVLDSASRQSISLGTGESLIVDDSASLRVSAGVSVFWDSPFGPVQFDFAQPLEHEEYDQTEEFRFSTRTNF
ncbi:outer membrane protein assembly factor BamA [Vitreimonas flagellata]|uniref:outer membrane protein assembly factor BamA n=1 Tax=Vitreimonas flagellata TaxID=2560861 RepID=UPI001074F9AD|nr:outer membrane protein assembly factor BamA [Vitreimonas flagellata]